MLHNEKVQAIQTELETTTRALLKSRGDVRRLNEQVKNVSAQLDFERRDSQQVLSETVEKALRKANIIIAVKERMITSRDAKLERAEQALRAADRSREDAVNAISLQLEEADRTSAERLATIRRICGKLGGRPNLSRTSDDLEELGQSTASKHQTSTRNW